MLKAVFFDLDDTLCDDALAWESSAAKAAQLGASHKPALDPKALASRFLMISEAYWMSLEPVSETRDLLTIRWDQWRRALEQEMHVDDPALAKILALHYGFRRSTEIALFPDALATLEYLNRRGYTLALITNGVQLTHLEKIEFLGLKAHFQHVLIADAVGHFKPDIRIFHEALRRCDCKAEEAVMVGDNLQNDVKGAQEAGIDAFWYNPACKAMSEGESAPARGELRSLSELMDRL